MAHDVFISHSNTDRTVANAVCAMLEQGGIRCWIAPRDVTPGKSWAGEIVRAIAEARIMVLIFSGEANRSPQILREVERAVGHRLVILPFKVEDVAPAEDLEYFISSQHWLDAVTPPLEKHIDYLARTVKRVLAESPREASRPVGADSLRADDFKPARDGPAAPKEVADVATFLGSAASPNPVTPTSRADAPPRPARADQRVVPPAEPQRDVPSRPRWIIPAAAAVLVLVAVGAFALFAGGDAPADTSATEVQLAQIENERAVAEQRKNDTDARAYVAADSIIAGARRRLAEIRSAGVPPTLERRVTQLDSTLIASRTGLRTACANEQAIGMTNLQCPEGQ